MWDQNYEGEEEFVKYERIKRSERRSCDFINIDMGLGPHKMHWNYCRKSWTKDLISMVIAFGNAQQLFFRVLVIGDVQQR